MFCPECKSEYRAGFTTCPDCNVPLVAQLTEDLAEAVDNVSEFVVAGTFMNEFDAEVAKTALDAAGIESIVRSDDSGREFPSMDITRGIQLLVKAADLSDAEAMLASDEPITDSGAEDSEEA